MQDVVLKGGDLNFNFPSSDDIPSWPRSPATSKGF